jgi:hypothetical protein
MTQINLPGEYDHTWEGTLYDLLALVVAAGGDMSTPLYLATDGGPLYLEASPHSGAQRSATRLHHYVWYSFCSAHRETDPQCQACHAGRWIDEADPAHVVDQLLFRDDPAAWIRKHNPGSSLCPDWCTHAEHN